MASPEDFLAQAIKLLGLATCDADYRVVIDRAYYGAYHASAQFEERLPVRSKADPKNVGSHEALIQRLERPNEQLNYGLRVISQDVGAQLRMLKPLREIASYDLKETIHVGQAEGAIRSARDIFEECKRGNLKVYSKSLLSG